MNVQEQEPFSSACPEIRQLLEYWRSIRPAGLFLGRQHLDPLAIGPLLSHVWLIDVHREPLRFRYRLVGSRIVERLGRELKGEWLDEAHPAFLQSAGYRDYTGVAEDGAAAWRRGPSTFTDDPRWRTIERIILPLAENGRVVDTLLGLTVSWSDPEVVPAQVRFSP
jgi:hypothetical protein